jgi:hypothetical protein
MEEDCFSELVSHATSLVATQTARMVLYALSLPGTCNLRGLESVQCLLPTILGMSIGKITTVSKIVMQDSVETAVASYPTRYRITTNCMLPTICVAASC